MPVIGVTIPYNIQFFDELWCFDGAYEVFLKRQSDHLSTDGSSYFLNEFPQTKIIQPPQFKTQLDKRNYCIEYAQKNLNDDDYFFIIDSDELILGNPKLWKPFLIDNKPKVVEFPIRSLTDRIQQYSYPRCFLNKNHFKYVDMRFALYSKELGILNDRNWVAFPNSTILNMKECYHEGYKTLARDFYRRRRIHWSRGGTA